MSETRWSGLRGKRFDFSAIKGGKMEYLIAGILGVVIIGAAILTIRQFMGSSEAAGPDTLTYKCEKANCGFEFPKKIKDLPVAKHPADEAKTMRLDCPKCGQKQSAWQATQCPNPNCKKWFIADSKRAHYAGIISGRGDMPARDICPYCKTDLQKWYIEHRPAD